ncbi:beta-galactosidase, partial [Streptomyces sp. NPDC053705]|uniref:beta-galactosidase n=1 Tax=Streptomyces sp. NPDC053705 TaxID=3156668 RepID=UPI0034230815
CFFQWRQSAAGAEKHHSAMVREEWPAQAVHRNVRQDKAARAGGGGSGGGDGGGSGGGD